jgi:hypothetical protein
VERRVEIADVAMALRRAADAETVWRSVSRAAPALGADHVRLELCCRHSGALAFANEPQRPDLHLTRHRVHPQRTDDVLHLGWKDAAAVDRDTEIAVELLCKHVATALDRVNGRSTNPAAAITQRLARLPQFRDEAES